MSKQHIKPGSAFCKKCKCFVLVNASGLCGSCNTSARTGLKPRSSKYEPYYTNSSGRTFTAVDPDYVVYETPARRDEATVPNPHYFPVRSVKIPKDGKPHYRLSVSERGRRNALHWKARQLSMPGIQSSVDDSSWCLDSAKAIAHITKQIIKRRKGWL